MSTEDEQNAYRRPTVSDSVGYVPATRRPGPVAIGFVVVAALIAAGATFFFTCLGAIAVADNEIGMVVCGVGALLGYILTARFGLAIVARLQSSGQVESGRQVSWLVIFLSACAVAAGFFGCLLITEGFFPVCAGILAGTVVLWKGSQRTRGQEKATLSGSSYAAFPDHEEPSTTSQIPVPRLVKAAPILVSCCAGYGTYAALFAVSLQLHGISGDVIMALAFILPIPAGLFVFSGTQRRLRAWRAQHDEGRDKA